MEVTNYYKEEWIGNIGGIFMEKFKYREVWSYAEEQDFSRLCTVEKLVDECILHKEIYIETKEDLERQLRNCNTYYNDGDVVPTYSEEEIKDMCKQFCERKDNMKKEWEYMNSHGEVLDGAKLLFP